MPVHLLKISATLSSSTRFRKSTPFSFIASHFASSSLTFACAAGILPYSISAALLRSPLRLARLASFLRLSIAFFASLMPPNTDFSFSNLAWSAFFCSVKFSISLSICASRSSFLPSSSILRASFSTWSVRMSRLALASSLGSLSICILSSAAASSMRSIALSGRNLSLM